MSFKRDGDDKSLLGTLRQRRIRDLLAVDIPEDEALLTSNGRLACTVCYHRPIFDTVEMLLVHRQGKKHAAGVEWKNREKKELQELILKRKHEQFLKDGLIDIKQVAGLPNNKKLCLGPAYDPRCQKTKAKQPKIKLDLKKTELTSVPMATTSCQLPGNRLGWNNIVTATNKTAPTYTKNNVSSETVSSAGNNSICSSRSDLKGLKKESDEKQDNWTAYNMILEKQMEGPVLHSHQLKHLFTKSNEGPIHITPYQSKKPRIVSQKDSSTLAFQGSLYNRKSFQNSKVQSLAYLPSKESHSFPTSDINHFYSNTVKDSSEQCQMNVNERNQRNVKTTCDQANAVSKESTSCSNMSPVDVQLKKEKAEKYLHYRGAGWKKDLFGNWVKDEEAEFDSDEEPPDLP